ncbi:MAG: alpha-amylase [Paraglaciecola sp.]|jgi:alpha-amylase
MASLLEAQQTQSNRINGTVHKTVPFINNHDTFRPQLDTLGNYTGWNTGSELSAHIESNEPRLATTYAVIIAMDGNPQIFFEDLFDVGYNSNRYSHMPISTTSLPAREDIINLVVPQMCTFTV